MKRIVNGSTYDPDNDTWLAHYCSIDQYSEGDVMNPHDHLLFITKDGRLYVCHCLRAGDDCFEPLTREGALQWLMDHGAGEEFCTSRLDELFPTTMVVPIRVPKDLWQRRGQAIRAGRTVPVNRLVTQLLEQELEKQTAA